MRKNKNIRFASRMDQLPPYLFGMMNRANVAVAPGVGFSEEGEGYLRLALVENEERLRQAVRQIKRALQELDSEM